MYSPSSPLRRILQRIALTPRLGLLLAVAGLAVYAVWLAPHLGVHAGASDTSGYMNQAKMLAKGHVHTPLRQLDSLPAESASGYLYVPLGYRPAPDEPSAMVPTYPVGLSLLLALGALLIGWSHGPALVMLAHALGGVAATYAFARVLDVPSRWAALAAALVGFSPLYLFLSLQALSDLPAMVWVTIALLLAERSRHNATWALAAGFSFALAVLIRPTNLLLVLPLVLALGLAPRRWLLLVVGGLPGAAFLALYHQTLYGEIFTTGYGNVESDFSRMFVGRTWAHYATWLPVLLTPLVVAFPGIGWKRSARRGSFLLLVWALVPLVFYSLYHYTGETWWFLRFVLPAFPPLAIGSVIVLETLVARLSPQLSRWRFFVPLGLLAAALLFAGHWTKRLNALYAGAHEALYVEVCSWVKAHLPPDSVILTMQGSGALLHYTSFPIVRWDHATEEEIERILALSRETQRPLVAALWENEAEALQRWRPTEWRQLHTIDQVTIWRYEPSLPGEPGATGAPSAD